MSCANHKTTQPDCHDCAMSYVPDCFCGELASVDRPCSICRAAEEAHERQLIEKIERCTICKTPTHASESDDFGVCRRCMVRGFFALTEMQHIAAAHLFLCHNGDADDCKNGCDASADPELLKLYIEVGEEVARTCTSAMWMRGKL